MPTQRFLRSLHRPFLLLAVLILTAAAWAGLARLGRWDLPLLRPALVSSHGPLMVTGFFGLLIGLERAVALRRPWTYAAPLLALLAALAAVLGWPDPAPQALMTAATAVLALVFLKIIRLMRDDSTLLMGLGALVWLAGNALWLADRPIYQVVPWWGVGLVLVIAGERLGLARLTALSPIIRLAFLGAVALAGVGLLVELPAPEVGSRLRGAGLLGLALWGWPSGAGPLAPSV